MCIFALTSTLVGAASDRFMVRHKATNTRQSPQDKRVFSSRDNLTVLLLDRKESLLFALLCAVKATNHDSHTERRVACGTPVTRRQR